MSAPQKTETGIAIIGMAGRFPKARNLNEFWRNLCDGVEGISFFTDEELAAAGADVPQDNPNFVRARGVLEDADLFDAAFFGTQPREAEVLDPQHRVFLECAWEALEEAGCDPARFDGAIGVFAGMSMNTYLAHNLLTHPDLIAQLNEHQLMLGNDKDYLPTRVSYKLNLRGPSVNIQTACSTSLVAVCVACQNLLSHECDLALAGAVSITFPQKRGYLYQEGGIASPDGHCRPFDSKAAGTVAGEGVALVALKRLENALAEGDHIYAIIKGFAINNDGSQKIGYTAPSVEGQAEVIATAQAMTGFAPETISHVEAHGTATPLGDPIEIEGLTKAFRAGFGVPPSGGSGALPPEGGSPNLDSRARAKNFCALGSVKSNIGHLDTAAGVAGLIKTALALHHQKLPPSLHFASPNPKIDFANSPFHVNAKLTEWQRGATPRRAGVSSFGIGGTNAHVVLEEAPARETSSKSRPVQLLLLSARTEAALDKATANLTEHLRQNPALDRADVAYTLQVGRHEFAHRRLLVCPEASDSKQVFARVVERENPPVVFLFPGQGAQHGNMGRELYEHEPLFREQVDSCCETLKPHLGLDLRTVLYPDLRSSRREEVLTCKSEIGNPKSKIEAGLLPSAATQIVQPALFVIEYALAKLWMSWGVKPEAMIGHSLGEYVAACLAGVFSLEDALALVAARGRLMQQMPAGTMLAVRLPEREVLPLLNAQLSLAAVNGATLCVVSGPDDAVAALEQQLAQREAAGTPLHTSHAFHSAMMQPMLKPFADLVSQVKLNAPQIPYVSNLTGTWITAAQATDPAYWTKHLRHTVRFADGLGELLKDPARILLEVGPGQTLSTLAKQHPAIDSKALVLSSLRRANETASDVEHLLITLGQLWLSGLEVDWRGFHAHERRRRVRLPTYPFERQRYFVEPQTRIRNRTGSEATPALTPGERIPGKGISRIEPLNPRAVSGSAGTLAGEKSHGQPAGKGAGAPGFAAEESVRRLSPPHEPDWSAELQFRALGHDRAKLELRAPAVAIHGPNARPKLEVEAPHEPTHPQPLPGWEQNSGRATAVPLLPASTSFRPDQLATPATRRERIAAELQTLLGELSGRDLAGVNGSTTFVTLGFDSLFLTQASLAIEKRFHTKVAFRQLMQELSTVEALAAHLDAALPPDEQNPLAPKAAEAAGNSFLRRDTGLKPGVNEIAASAPLTEAQKEIWFAAQMSDGASCAYNETRRLHFRGPLRVAALRAAGQRLVDRHEALRVTISPLGDEQRVHPQLTLDVPLIDWSPLDAAQREARLEALEANEASQPFDLVNGPLVRARLVRLAAEHHVLLLTIHHLVCDGRSWGVLLHELARLYSADCGGTNGALAAPQQLSEFARAQARRAASPERAAAEAYWLKQFADGAPVLELPTDRPRPATWTFNGARECRMVNGPLTQRLKQLSAQHNCTLFTTLLAAYYLLLHKLTHQDDLVVGIPTADSALPGSDTLVGHGINFLPVRRHVAADSEFVEFLTAVKQTFLEAHDHQHCPFGRLIQELNRPRDPGRMPLVSVTFNVDRLRELPRFFGLETDIASSRTSFTNFDLSFNVTEIGEELRLDCRFNTSLFSPETIQRWLRHFETLLEQIVAGPQPRLADWSLLSAAERRQILVEWNDTCAGYPLKKCVHQLFEEQAGRTPGAVAVECNGQSLTYRELNDRADELARQLRALGVGPDVPVGIALERSRDMVAGVLAVLKAGGAYVPLDPAYPPERLAFMLEDARAPVLVTQQSLRENFKSQIPNLKLLCIDTPIHASRTTHHDSRSPQPSTLNPQPSTTLAYIIHTSGSTGVPKGVAIEHGSAVNFISWAHRAFTRDELAGVLFSTSLCFDLSVFELFVPLSRGGKVIIARNALELPRLPAKDEVTLINTVPSAIAELLRLNAIPPSVRAVNLAGEPLKPALVDRLCALGTVKQVRDLYGPTETTTYSTCALRRAGAPETVGRPIANTQIYILDARRQPVPVGVPGEIYIGGEGLARGYLHRPDLTAERFVPNPFRDEAERGQPCPRESAGRDERPDFRKDRQAGTRRSALLYRTGDLARRLPDGNIEFLGRADHQVKIRGYRVELGEIETVLGQHPAVRECVVLAREETPGEKRLLGYVVTDRDRRSDRPLTLTLSPSDGEREQQGAPPDNSTAPIARTDGRRFSLSPSDGERAGVRGEHDGAVTESELREFLKTKLPDYMMPSAFVFLDALPRTPNGKVNRRALPAPDATRPELKESFVAPGTPTEEALAAIWREVLRLERVGARDNFFELGGHSLLMMQVLARARETFQVELPIRRFFESPIVADLAAAIEELLVEEINALSEEEARRLAHRAG